MAQELVSSVVLFKRKIEYYEENRAPRYSDRGFLQFPMTPTNVSIVPIRSEVGCGRIYPLNEIENHYYRS